MASISILFLGSSLPNASYPALIRCAFDAPARKSYARKPSSSPSPRSNKHWKQGEFPSEPSRSYSSSRSNKHWKQGEFAPEPSKSFSSSRSNKHWKQGEFPPEPSKSFSSSSRSNKQWKQGEFSSDPSNSFSSSRSNKQGEFPSEPSNWYSSKSPAVEKKRLWKKGEFPGSSGSRKGPTVKKADLRESSKYWVCTVTETLVDRIHKKQWVQALQVFDMLREQPFYHPKEGTYMKLIVLLGRCGQPQHAHRIFDLMVEEGLVPTAALYTALLGAYCRSNLVEEAFTVLNQMKTHPQCQPDVYTYSILIKACVDASHYDLVASLYGEMEERSISPNTVTQNIVLSGYGKVEKYDQMEKVLSGMLESQTSKPDVWTMNTILSIFGNKGHIEMMEQWYEKFRNFGVEPETRTFNILIGAYGKKRMYDKMSTVLEYMRKLEFPWTTSTYNNVIEAFANVGDAKQMEYTFDQMRGEGMKADTKTFCCLINGYANAGLFHKVISSVQLAGKFEVRENTAFFNAIISACAMSDDLMEMERVYKNMKDKQCQPDSTTYSLMVEAYRKKDMNDKIYYLELEKDRIDNGAKNDKAVEMALID